MQNSSWDTQEEDNVMRSSAEQLFSAQGRCCDKRVVVSRQQDKIKY
jgi:hypothetical protein